jgi:hypothetical protein
LAQEIKKHEKQPTANGDKKHVQKDEIGFLGRVSLRMMPNRRFLGFTAIHANVLAMPIFVAIRMRHIGTAQVANLFDFHLVHRSPSM